MRRFGKIAREFSILATAAATASVKSSAMTLRWVFAALLGAILLTFQNCTQPAQMDEIDANSALSEKMNFSYDTVLDQIAYMSCPNVVTAEKLSVDSDLYFTFRAGAYRFGGVKLKESFFQTYQEKLPERMITLLQNSPANSNTVLQLAVRQTGNLNAVVINGGTPKQNIEFSNMLAVLGSSELSTNLVNTGLDTKQDPPLMTQKRIKYLRDGTGRGAHLEGNLNFGSSENMQASLRNTYMGSGSAILALTYLEPTTQAGGGQSGPSTDTNVRNQSTIGASSDPDPESTPPPSTPGLAFGTGYLMTFSQPVSGARGLQEQNSGSYTGKENLPYPSNVVTSVQEKDLSTGAHNSSAQWSCPASLKYMIVRPGDENDVVGGPCLHSPDPLEPWDPEFAILRRALRSEDWYIDRDHKCVIPKRSAGFSCYGDMNKISYVQYNLTDNTSTTRGCDPHSDATSNKLNNKICAAWISVCYRLSP
jgi:hypothetical protein